MLKLFKITFLMAKTIIKNLKLNKDENMYVETFENISKDDVGIAGGKGANLGELTQAGIPVPPGFVVTAETYNKFMNDTGIFDNIMNILSGIDINNTKELQNSAEKIKKLSLKLIFLKIYQHLLLKLIMHSAKKLELKMFL